MKNAESVLAVKFQSSLSSEALGNTCVEDLEQFRNVPGLIQKYYLGEEGTGAISGIYIFESKIARDKFWSSDLAAGIPSRYGVVPGSLRAEQYEMSIILNDGVMA